MLVSRTDEAWDNADVSFRKGTVTLTGSDIDVVDTFGNSIIYQLDFGSTAGELHVRLRQEAMEGVVVAAESRGWS